VSGNRNTEIRNAASTLVLCVGIQGVFVATYLLFAQIEGGKSVDFTILVFSAVVLALSVVVFMMMRIGKSSRSNNIANRIAVGTQES